MNIKNKMLKSLFQLNKDFHQRGVFLNLSGPLSQNLMVEMGGLMKRKMELAGSDASVIRKAFSILVELNQNIIHYSAEKEPNSNQNEELKDSGCGIISVGCEGDHYFLLSGNMIDQGNVEKLTKRLISLQTMDKEELKKQYREQRKKGPDEDSKGAGLGLIEMARKVNKPLEFKINKINDTHSFFILKTII
ncbi:SiaB family protein kinase [bacterium]|nr:SiaB family protein kinase [bacterium]